MPPKTAPKDTAQKDTASKDTTPKDEIDPGTPRKPAFTYTTKFRQEIPEGESRGPAQASAGRRPPETVTVHESYGVGAVPQRHARASMETPGKACLKVGW